MSSTTSDTTGEEFGFVSRDQNLLDRVEQQKDGPETNKEGKFRSDSQETATAVTDVDDEKQQQGDSPHVSKRGSMASIGSETKISSSTSTTSKIANTEVTLPQTFQVKYLGRRDARGLWGIKHTRRPVDAMVATAKSAATTATGAVLPVVKLTVSQEGVTITETRRNKDKTTTSATVAFHAIDTISYGVQDLVYTRVFSMIIVRESAELKGQHPFECHAFVCDSRAHARKLTYALAAAFHEYSRSVRSSSASGSLEGVGKRAKKFAIDLRTPEQIEKDLQTPQEADSEA